MRTAIFVPYILPPSIDICPGVGTPRNNKMNKKWNIFPLILEGLFYPMKKRILHCAKKNNHVLSTKQNQQIWLVENKLNCVKWLAEKLQIEAKQLAKNGNWKKIIGQMHTSSKLWHEEDIIINNKLTRSSSCQFVIPKASSMKCGCKHHLVLAKCYD